MNGILTTVSTMRQIFRLLLAASPATLACIVVLVVTSAATPAAALYATKELIDSLTASSAADHEAGVWLAILVGTWILDVLLQPLLSYAKGILSERTSTAAQTALFAKASTLDLSYYDDARNCDTLYMANDEMYRIEAVAWACLDTLRSAAGLAALAAILSVLHPIASILLLITALPRLILDARIGNWRLDLEVRLTRNHRMSGYLGHLLTSREAAKEVRIMNFAKPILSRFSQLRENHLTAVRRVAARIGATEGVLQLVSVAGTAGVCAWAVAVFSVGGLTLGGVVMTLQATQQMRSQLAVFLSTLTSIQQNALFAGRFFALLKARSGGIEGPMQITEGPTGKVREAVGGHLAFSDVWFRYPGTSRWILRGVNFKVPKDSCVAIVGENGEGKSTLLNLIARLYDPERGAVLLDGTDVRQLPIRAFRELFGVCFQDHLRLELTLRENILLGRSKLDSPDGSLEHAVAFAGLDDLVSTLPEGLDTVLGRSLGKGVDLSGGDWQRVAIARSLISDAPILLMDEPSASLDAISENELFTRLGELAGVRTMVIVSHRLSTVRFADEILVLSKGMIAERGTHVELMRLGGRYARMFSVQAERYGVDGDRGAAG